MHKYLNAFLPIILVALVSGCASTGVSPTQISANQIDSLHGQILKEKEQVNKTVAVLNLLPGLTGQPLQKQFNSFSTELGRTESLYHGFERSLENLKMHKSTYLAKWETDLVTFTDPELKSRSQKRLEEVRSDLDKVVKDGDETKEAFDPYLNYLRQIKKYLVLDLTPTGVDSIKDLINKTNNEAQNLNKNIDDFIATLTDVHKELSLQDSKATK